MTEIKPIPLLILVFVCGALAGFGIASQVFPAHPVAGLQPLSTPGAPAPVGPYSQAVKYGGFVFTSGQIGLDPVTGNLSPTVEEQAIRAMENLKAVLAEEGLSFSDVVQTHIYLADLNDWNTVNTVYGRYFETQVPARSVVEVKGLPRGAKIEIEMIAQEQ
jgi:2-iminobutanoate/2-iminopropanoate deaminase